MVNSREAAKTQLSRHIAQFRIRGTKGCGSPSCVYKAIAYMAVGTVFHISPPISHASGHERNHGFRGAVLEILFPYRPLPEAVRLFSGQYECRVPCFQIFRSLDLVLEQGSRLHVSLVGLFRTLNLSG